jgi:Insertion element 4 transposase N-terminal/Transposase DDE domain
MTSPESRPRLTDGINIGVLTRIFHRDLVDDVLRETGKTGERTRLMPGRVTVYFVLAMCLFFDDAYEEVMRKLVNGLRFLGNWAPNWHVPTSSAMSRARSRLEAAPLAALFDRVAVPMARPATIGAWFHGWRVMAVDGVVFDVPDTPENLAEFGKVGSGRNRSPYPQLRLVGLGECGTHAIVDAAFDAGKTSERALIQRLIPGFEPGMLVLCDRGFYSYQLWQAASATGAALLWRLKNDIKIPALTVLPDGSYLSELLPRQLKANQRASQRRGGRAHIPDEARLPVRVVEYTIPNRDGKVETIKIITTILDPEQATADELAALYNQRWEFELTLDEVETHQMPADRMLRSRTPELVRQEIWALLLTHYAVRAFMREAADDVADDVDRLSFIRSIRVIRRQVENQAGFSPSPPDDRHP